MPAISARFRASVSTRSARHSPPAPEPHDRFFNLPVPTRWSLEGAGQFPDTPPHRRLACCRNVCPGKSGLWPFSLGRYLGVAAAADAGDVGGEPGHGRAALVRVVHFRAQEQYLGDLGSIFTVSPSALCLQLARHYRTRGDDRVAGGYRSPGARICADVPGCHPDGRPLSGFRLPGIRRIRTPYTSVLSPSVAV
jgi:hypothetical protein